MAAYTIRRLILMIPTLLGITLVTFIIIHAAPGDPISQQLYAQSASGVEMNEAMTKQMVEELRKFYGLDKPIHIQYVIWLKRIAFLDFGKSLRTQEPVLKKIGERLPWSMELNILSILISYLISIPLGIWTSVKQFSLFDKISGFIVYMLYSLPSFWIALLLIMLFGVKLRWFPFSGYFSLGYGEMSWFEWGKIMDHLKHLILPLFCYTYGSFAYTARFVRGNMLEVIRQDYIRTARAKGVEEKRVILRHAFRNSLIPIVTLFGLLLPILISGSVIIEMIFNWPGMGWLFFQAIMTRDYPLILGLSVISALLVLLATLLADLLYAVVDPRITYS